MIIGELGRVLERERALEEKCREVPCSPARLLGGALGGGCGLLEELVTIHRPGHRRTSGYWGR
jgi:hypothetical protein